MREDKNLKANLAASYNELVRSFTALACETIGNYSLGREVGKGSYGHAYQATHKFLGGKVVLKGTPKSEAPTLAREIHHHRRLHHPHVVQLYEVIVTEERVWLVLEHCGGGELYEYLLKRRQLTERETKKIFAQICGAVAYIHSRGIVHRDLKLENIFLDRKNNVKLGDFGFTRENDKGFMKTWCGSTAYSAPEILRCSKYQGEPVDIWSLGIILFALLSGQLPYDEEDELATKRMILESQPVFPPFFSDEMTQLITSMLNKDPEKRPSAQDILQHPF
ncbi:kinase-like domain-containing protein, partial [Protomyces lactucae-debilis]